MIIAEQIAFVRYYPKNLDTFGQMSLSHSKVASTVKHQHPSAVLHSCSGVP